MQHPGMHGAILVGDEAAVDHRDEVDRDCSYGPFPAGNASWAPPADNAPRHRHCKLPPSVSSSRSPRGPRRL
eukprot:8307333-Alexandrium_andersonii.AAC.1